MKNYKSSCIFIIVSCLALFSGKVVSQVAIGEWSTHISYNKIISVTSSSEAVYAASERGNKVKQKEEKNLQKISTENRLEETKISEI